MIGTHSLLYMMVLSVLQPPSAIGHDAERAVLLPKSHFRAIARLTGRHLEAYSIQEIGYQFSGDYERAMKELSEAIRLEPKDAINYNNRGLAYRAKHEYEKAMKDFCEAIRLDPKMPAAYTNRGEVYAARKEYEKAIQDHTKAISLDAECEEALENRARVYLKTKEFDRAIKGLTEAIRARKNFVKPSLFLERGFVYAAKSDSDNAIGDFSEAIALHMRYRTQIGWRCPQAYFYRGIAYLTRKKYHLGFEDIKDYWRSITDKGLDSFYERMFPY
jgi:tetratricopeptide (TPR) repeat protein